MTNKQETVADIVREMRGDPSEQLSSWEDTINTRRIVRQFLVNYADRIEAAHNRVARAVAKEKEVNDD